MGSGYWTGTNFGFAYGGSHPEVVLKANLSNIQNYLHLSPILKTTELEPISGALEGQNLAATGGLFVRAIWDN